MKHLLALLIFALCVWCFHCKRKHSCGQTVILTQGVNETSMQTILNVHNTLRAKVANGNETKTYTNAKLMPAADMLQMEWDEKLAEKAQEWANACDFNHDTPADRNTGRGETGQNIAATYNSGRKKLNWTEVIHMWYDEVPKFHPHHVDKYIFDSKTGHFTQIIWAKTFKIGCGYSRFDRNGWENHYYCCNYLPSGNWVGQPIYIKGEPCSKCGGCGNIEGLCVPGQPH